MEVLIDDIPEDGLTLHADSKKDSWLMDVFQDAIRDRFTREDVIKLTVTFIKYEGNIDVTGGLNIISHRDCDRCLKNYLEKTSIPFHLIMAPLFESKRHEQKEVDMQETAIDEITAFSYYDGDRIDLDEIIREQIILAEPTKHLCQEACKGLCQKCGKDLNEGPCSCVEEKHDSRWDVLKNLKPAKKKAVRSSKSSVRGRKDRHRTSE